MSEPLRKRRRPAKACEQCRQRKVRCDLNVPCGPCTRAKASLACSYRDGQPDDQYREQPKPAQSRPRPQNNSLLSPASLPEPGTNDDVIRDIQTRLGTLEKQTATSQSTITTSLERELRDLKAKVDIIEHQHVPAEKDPRSASVGVLSPRLRSSSHKVKFMGSTHWCHKMDQLLIANMLGKPDPDSSLADLHTQTVSMIKKCRDLRQALKNQRSVQVNDPLSDLRSTLPDREECDELVRCYLQTFEPIYRVIHIPSFWTQYEEFWRETEPNNHSFSVKLVLILAIGTVFHSNKPTENEYHHLVQKWIFAAQLHLTGPAEKSTSNLDGIQTMCLLLIARKACGLGPSSWVSAGSLTRAAVGMGLHRDPAMFPSLSKFAAETRVRLWNTILELVLQDALDSGVSLCLPAKFDVPKLGNVNDNELENAEALTSEASERVTDTSVQILLSESLKLRIQVLEVLHDTKGQSYQVALDLGHKLRAASRKAAAFFHPAENQPSNTTNSLEANDFQAAFIDILLHRYIVTLYTPFVVQARKDPHFYFARKACLKSARTIASYADRLKLPLEIPDNLGKLFLSGKGSSKGPLSLDVISVLGLEVVTLLEEVPDLGLPGPGVGALNRFIPNIRAKILQSLEHIKAQLFQEIAAGNPSMKRFGLLAAKLGQIRAMQGGRDVKRGVYEAVSEALRECHAVLEPFVNQGDRGDCLVGSTSSDPTAPASDVWDADPTFGTGEMDFGESLYDMDLQSLFPSGLDGNFLSLFG